MRVAARFLRIGLLLSTGIVPTASRADDGSAGTPPGEQLRQTAEDEQLIRGLFAQWESQSTAIATAHIHHRTYSGGFPHSLLTMEDVDALLARHDLVGDPESFRSLLTELLRGGPGAPPTMSESPWFVREYHQLGDQYRDRHADGTLQIISGEHEFLFESGKSRNQATLFARGGSWLLPPGLHLFLRDPSRGLPRERFRVLARGEVTELEIIPAEGVHPADWMWIDPATGLMVREVGYHNGLPYREFRQLGLTEYAGGIVLPAVSLTLDYRDGVLRHLFYRAIDSAVLNGPVAEELFEMPVEANTVVVDQRGAESVVVHSAEAADDVVSFLSRVAGPPPGPPEPRDSLWRWVLTFNGLGLMALSVVFWRRSQVIAQQSLRSHVEHTRTS